MFANDRRVCAVTPPPESVGEQYHAIAARLLLLPQEEPAQYRLHADQSEKVNDASARWLSMLQTHRPTPLSSGVDTPQLTISNVNRSLIVAGVEDASSSARRARDFAKAAKERDANREIRRTETALLALASLDATRSR